jgi:tetratricopeptide (TPR) repeat protein
VDEYGPKGQWKELGAVLDGMDHRRLPTGEQEMWYRARGIVEFRTNQRARAREIFEEGVRQFPNSGWLNFGLGQEYEAQGRVDEMAARFQRVRLESVGSRSVLVIARYYYLWNRFELGQLAIQPIFDRYYELKIADDMFLYMRGLPMFDESFGYRATFARLAGKTDQARYELARARSELSDVDVESHELDLEATRTGKWEPVLLNLESLLKSLDARTPTGQPRMKRAVLRCRTAMTVEAALGELDAVQLTPDDHAWLEDIRNLARAELFHRFDMPDREQAALSEFLPRQALLFEPNHAFTFGFIDYQETLKPRYQSHRDA